MMLWNNNQFGSYAQLFSTSKPVCKVLLGSIEMYSSAVITKGTLDFLPVLLYLILIHVYMF